MALKQRHVTGRDSQALQKVRSSNQADAAFTAPAATTTEPTGGGVVNVRSQGSAPLWVFLMAYGDGSNNDVFDMWVTGWRPISAGGTTLWVPTRLVKLTWTISAAVGVAGSPVLATERFADTVTASMGISNTSYQLFSPADDTPAHALVSPDGCPKLEFTFDNTTGTSNTNCLWARI